jgi:hypothetical protein
MHACDGSEYILMLIFDSYNHQSLRELIGELRNDWIQDIKESFTQTSLVFIAQRIDVIPSDHPH